MDYNIYVEFDAIIRGKSFRQSVLKDQIIMNCTYNSLWSLVKNTKSIKAAITINRSVRDNFIIFIAKVFHGALGTGR